MENDSSGDRNQETLAKNRNSNGNGERKIGPYDRPGNCGRGGDGDKTEDEEECDAEMWDSLSKSFSQVQSVLDQNNVLIQQVNENHQSLIPDNLAKNVALIREINSNISKVVSLYSDLSVDFSSVVHQRRPTPKTGRGDGNRKEGEAQGILMNEK